MGNTCGITTVYNQKEHQRVPTPHAIDDIGGFRVDREHAQYQYTLLCVTRLAEKYMSNMFPDVHTSLVKFGERQIDYLNMTNELYNALSFPERSLKNSEVDATADCLAKEAISELTLFYMGMCKEEQEHEAKEKPEAEKRSETEERPEAEERSQPEVVHQPTQRKDVQDQGEFEMFYDDTLKMIITDIEKKNVWHDVTFFSNQSFHDLLERKEPELAKSLSTAPRAEVAIY